MILALGAAGLTVAGALPANPRVPAVVAALTMAVTVGTRFVVGYEPMWFASPLHYTGPADSALYWESGICALNVLWGLMATRRTPKTS